MDEGKKLQAEMIEGLRQIVEKAEVLQEDFCNFNLAGFSQQIELLQGMVKRAGQQEHGRE